MSAPESPRPTAQFVISGMQAFFGAMTFIFLVGGIAVTFASRVAVVEVQASQVPSLALIVASQSAQIAQVIEAQKAGRAERLKFQEDVLNKLDRITAEIRR